MAGSVNSNTVNLGGADPIQGFDVGVFWHDRADGRRVLVGQATSMVITVRNATEAYMEFGQRYARYLDGEIQIGYVIERGFIDIRCFQETFGFKSMNRTKRFGRSPRFDITFACNPVDADALESQVSTAVDSLDGSTFSRDVTGRFVIECCKIDSWHLAATGGRQVVATQWQGVAEGINVISSDYSVIDGLTTPTLQNAGNNVGEAYRTFTDGVAYTNPAFQGNTALGQNH